MKIKILNIKLAALAAVLATSIAAANAAPKPNIVFIMADDIGYGDVGCYGAQRVKTPHLDRLAREGLRFTDAHTTASVCTPTRFAFLTGQYAWRQKGTGIAAGDEPALIQPGTPTLPSMLKSVGYRTGLVGKWHLGLGHPPKTDFNADIKPGPLELGFDYAFYIPATGDRVPCVWVENHRVVGLATNDPIQVSYGKKIGNEPTGRDSGVKLKVKGDNSHSDTVINGIPRIGFMTGGKSAHWVDEDIADTITAKAVSFIETNRANPFFLFLATHDIHEPMIPHPRFRGTSDCGWRGDVIHQLDWTVGEVLKTLDRLHLATNTLVIFTSDNGGAIKSTYDDGTNPLHERQPPNGVLRGRKSTLYEGGHRVPFIARWLTKIPAGRESAALIGTVDMFSSLASLTAGTLAPAAAPDSFDVLPALLGQSPKGREHLVLQNNNAFPLALREGDWVLIEAGGRRTGGATAHELYNLATDLAQTNNLAARQPEKEKAMAARLEEIRAKKQTRP
jgi:arylsulfatase A-like enzyme